MLQHRKQTQHAPLFHLHSTLSNPPQFSLQRHERLGLLLAQNKRRRIQQRPGHHSYSVLYGGIGWSVDADILSSTGEG
jgi:hypothetical protein